jgi:hypothetical protein
MLYISTDLNRTIKNERLRSMDAGSAPYQSCLPRLPRRPSDDLTNDARPAGPHDLDSHFPPLPHHPSKGSSRSGKPTFQPAFYFVEKLFVAAARAHPGSDATQSWLECSCTPSRLKTPR